MLEPPPNEKPLKRLLAQTALSMQHPALPACRNMLNLSIGLSSVFNVLCTPALAKFPQEPTAGRLDLSYEPRSPASAQLLTAGLAGYAAAVTNDSPLQSLSSCDQANDCPNSVAVNSPPSAPQRLENIETRTLGDAQISQFFSEKRVASALDESGIGNAIAQWPTEARHYLPDEADVIQAAERKMPEAVYGQGDRPIATIDLKAESTSSPDIADLPSEILEPSTSSLRENLIQMTGSRQTAETQIAETQTAETQTAAGAARSSPLDADLGTLRVKPLQSRREDEELGILRLLQTAQVRPPESPPPIAFLVGRLGYFSTDNAFRSDPSLSEQISQTALSLYVAPRLSERTSLYVIAETSLARYSNLEGVSYNTLETQVGIRQRLLPRTYAQIGWRNQRLYSPGYKEKLFSVNAVDALISHRTILSSQMWLDSFYQARLGFASPKSASRFRQTLTLSLNYGVTRNLRSSLIYQVDFDKYTQISRFDSYQQVLGAVSYNINDRSRISLFGGTRFGRSSSPGIDLDDTFYGAGFNVSLPLF